MDIKNKEFVSFRIEHRDKDGNLIEVISSDPKINDLVVNTGLALRAALLGGVSSPVALNAIAVGTGTTTPAATDTALQTEVARVASTNSVVTTTNTNDTLEMSATITFTSSYTITEVGTFNSTTASSGTMYSHDLLPGSGSSVVSGSSLSFVFKFQQVS